MTFPAPPGRDLEPRELAGVADEMARRPELWSRQVAFSTVGRHYACLYRDDHLDVWLLCWTRESDTGWHDHDGSAGAVRVVSGALTESNPRIGGAPGRVLGRAGSSFAFGPHHIHRLSCRAARGGALPACAAALRPVGEDPTDGAGA